MVRWKLEGGISRGFFLAILVILAILAILGNFYGCYFLVRGGDKKCGEYKS